MARTEDPQRRNPTAHHPTATVSAIAGSGSTPGLAPSQNTDSPAGQTPDKKTRSGEPRDKLAGESVTSLALSLGLPLVANPAARDAIPCLGIDLARAKSLGAR